LVDEDRSVPDVPLRCIVFLLNGRLKNDKIDSVARAIFNRILVENWEWGRDMTGHLANPSSRAFDLIVEAIRGREARRGGPLVVAFDGRSGVGKSTLATCVASLIDAVVVESDDFYAGGTDEEWMKRTAKEKVDLCIDWRRLRTEALEPLVAGCVATWHPFSFASGEGLADHTVSRSPAPVIILDGVYSARLELADLVDLTVLVNVSNDFDRRGRLLAREGKNFMTAWHALWDDAEDYYFTHVRPPESFDLVVFGD
jgi:uridine kinase